MQVVRLRGCWNIARDTWSVSVSFCSLGNIWCFYVLILYCFTFLWVFKIFVWSAEKVLAKNILPKIFSTNRNYHH